LRQYTVALVTRHQEGYYSALLFASSKRFYRPEFRATTRDFGFFIWWSMNKISCQNNRQASRYKKCNKFLLSVPDCVLSLLKSLEGEEEAKIIVNCSSCRAVRFAEILYVNGELTFRSIVDKPDLGTKILFKNRDVCSEAPLIEMEE
jgi:hypothetical protein